MTQVIDVQFKQTKKLTPEREILNLSNTLDYLTLKADQMLEEGTAYVSDNSYKDSDTGYNLVDDVTLSDEYEKLLDQIEYTRRTLANLEKQHNIYV